MENLSRRTALKGAGVLGAAGAASLVAPATPWTWSPAYSIPGTGTGKDPRTVWDPEADEVIARLFRNPGQVQRVNNLLKGWTKNSQPLPAGLPNELRDFIEHARRLPAWTDWDRLDAAVRFNQKRGLYLGVIYGFASGMMSTVIPREARAVYYSKGGWDLKDRISKTAKFGYDVGALNAFRPGGEMIVTCVKTRMAHAGVRHLLPQSGHWQAVAPESKPISQADIMVTWHSLPTTVMRNLRKWRVPMENYDGNGLLHSWQVTASLLGVHDEYIPNSWGHAESQARQVLDPILAPTPEGRRLANELLNLGVNLDLTLLSRGVLGALTRYVLGDKMANWYHIPREPVWSPLLETAWVPFVGVREGLLGVGVPKETYWMFDELLRQFVLLYMSELRMPISIQIPTFNNPKYK